MEPLNEQIIALPNGDEIIFPGDMPDEAIENELRMQYPELMVSGPQTPTEPYRQTHRQDLYGRLQPLDESGFAPNPLTGRRQDFMPNRPGGAFAEEDRVARFQGAGSVFKNSFGENVFVGQDAETLKPYTLTNPQAIELILNGALPAPDNQARADGIAEYFESVQRIAEQPQPEYTALERFALMVAPGMALTEEERTGAAANAQLMQFLQGTAFIGEGYDELIGATLGREEMERARGLRDAFRAADPEQAAMLYTIMKGLTTARLGFTKFGQTQLAPRGGKFGARVLSSGFRSGAFSGAEAAVSGFLGEGGVIDRGLDAASRGLIGFAGGTFLGSAFSVPTEGLKAIGNKIAGNTVSNIMNEYGVSERGANLLLAAARASDWDAFQTGVLYLGNDMPAGMATKSFQRLMYEASERASPSSRREYLAFQKNYQTTWQKTQEFLDRYFAPSTPRGIEAVRQSVRDNVNSAAERFFDQAFKYRISWDSDQGIALQQIFEQSEPAVRNQIALLMRLRGNRGFSFQQQPTDEFITPFGVQTQRMFPPGEKPGVQYFHDMKRIYQRKADEAFKAGDRSLATQYNNFADQIKLILTRDNPAYETALSMTHRGFTTDDALLAGYEAIRTNGRSLQEFLDRIAKQDTTIFTIDDFRPYIMRSMRMGLDDSLSELSDFAKAADVTDDMYVRKLDAIFNRSMFDNLKSVLTPAQYRNLTDGLQNRSYQIAYNRVMGDIENRSMLIELARAEMRNQAVRGPTGPIQAAAGQGEQETLFFGPIQMGIKYLTTSDVDAYIAAQTEVADELTRILLNIKSDPEGARAFIEPLRKAVFSELPGNAMDAGIARGLSKFLNARSTEVREILGLIEPGYFAGLQTLRISQIDAATQSLGFPATGVALPEEEIIADQMQE